MYSFYKIFCTEFACTVWCWWWKKYCGVATVWRWNIVIFEILRSNKGLLNILFSTLEAKPNTKIFLEVNGSSEHKPEQDEKNETMRNWPEVKCLKNESKTFWYVHLMVDNYILYFRWFSECLIHTLVSVLFNL